MSTIARRRHVRPAGLHHARAVFRASRAPWPPTSSGLQMSTVRNLVAAWVLTLPAAILLSGTLYWIFRHIF